MNTDYQDLDLIGAFVKEVILIPGQKLTIKVLRGPVKKGDGNVVEELMLEVGNLRTFDVELRSDPVEPSIEIVSHSILDRNPSVDDTTAFELVIRCDKGHFSISAGTFTWAVIDEIPFFSSLAPAEIDSEKVLKQLESEQVICSFCRREAAGVPRIVKGNDACICSDCVEICLRILKPGTTANDCT